MRITFLGVFINPENIKTGVFRFVDISIEGAFPEDILREARYAVSDRNTHTVVLGLFRVTTGWTYGFFMCQIYNPQNKDSTGLPKHASMIYKNIDTCGTVSVNNGTVSSKTFVLQ